VHVVHSSGRICREICPPPPPPLFFVYLHPPFKQTLLSPGLALIHIVSPGYYAMILEENRVGCGGASEVAGSSCDVRFLVCRRAQSRAVEAGLEAGDNVTALVHPLGRLDNNDEGECQP
jgi:hypothetical protein